MDQKSKRLRLQQEFEDILGSKNVYFQPPETLKMNYPCIVYFKTSIAVKHANNKVYKYDQAYTVTYVDKNPDSEVPYTILKHFGCTKPDSFYKSENLNHTKFTIFY
jgi:hypothetical protein